MSTYAKSAISNSVDFEDQARRFDWSGNKLEPGIGLALSGGGYRAMLFHAGALTRLNELGLLSKVDRISSVSGGSIAAGYLAKAWPSLGAADARGVFSNFKSLVVDKLLVFSKEKIDVLDTIIGLLPFTSVAEQVARSYNKALFDGLSLQQLPDRPRFVFCATNLQTGVLWRFSKPYAGDYITGYLDKPDDVARVVAASAAFPPILSPFTLAPSPSAFKNWPTSPGQQRPDPAPYRGKVVLVDGGVYDNHGLEPIVKRYMTLFVSDGGAPFARMSNVHTGWLNQLRRVLDLADNQVRALRRRDLVTRLTKGNSAFESGALGAMAIDDVARMGAYWGIDTDTARTAPLHALGCDRSLVEELAALPTRLTDLGDKQSKRLVNWGYAICDRSVRSHYRGPVPAAGPDPVWPFSDASLG